MTAARFGLLVAQWCGYPMVVAMSDAAWRRLQSTYHQELPPLVDDALVCCLEYAEGLHQTQD